MSAALKKELDDALLVFCAGILSRKEMSKARQTFLTTQMCAVVHNLAATAKTIRENAHLPYGAKEGWRDVQGTLDALSQSGQAISSFLFCFNLRNQITDKIEAEYGVDFSGQRIYRIVVRKEDGAEHYLLFKMEGSPSVTLMRNREMSFMPVDDFLAKFYYKEYS